MFEQSMVAVPRRSGRATTFAVSTTLQVAVVGTLLLAPLIFIERPSLIQLDYRLLAPPRPAPPPSVKLVEVPKALYKSLMDSAKLVMPSRIPDQVAKIIDDLPTGPEPAIYTGAGVVGAIGDPGAGGGALGLFQNSRVAPPPVEVAKPVERSVAAAPPAPAKPVRVGGAVQEAKIIRRILPVYPPLAKAARISGTVKLIGILSRDGRIQELKVIEGHPLLVAAAVEAVRQWVYQPTLLNEQPVEVIAPIDVHFRLN
ncbi:MAG: energy transducer TonB [Bryobacterales bacterium]|nr:energy transducer TonB [Bryobacterales bacterium]